MTIARSPACSALGQAEPWRRAGAAAAAAGHRAAAAASPACSRRSSAASSTCRTRRTRRRRPSRPASRRPRRRHGRRGEGLDRDRSRRGHPQQGHRRVPGHHADAGLARGCRSPPRHRPARLGRPARRRRHRDRDDRGRLLPRDVRAARRRYVPAFTNLTPTPGGRRRRPRSPRPRSRPSSATTSDTVLVPVAQVDAARVAIDKTRPRPSTASTTATSCSTSSACRRPTSSRTSPMKRALEGELANQIQNIAGVSEADGQPRACRSSRSSWPIRSSRPPRCC